MIFLHDISLSFGARDIFDGLNLDIKEGDKIALIGRNGVGKTTLLRIIAGEIKPDKGSVFMAKDIRIGYLPQIIKVDDKRSLLAEAMTAFDEVNSLKKRFEKLNTELINRKDYTDKQYMKIADELARISHRLEVLEADRIEEFTREVLLGLGFKPEQFQLPTANFSGGWRMRIEIAKLLLRKPDVLLLDEPTNHLDIQSIIWLEEFLKNYSGSMVLISHDKRFLNSVTNRTVELTESKIYDFKVSYFEYEKLKKKLIENLQQEYNNQKRKIKETQRFIERFRYKATKASQVQSRIKQLSKLPDIEVYKESKMPHILFPAAPRSGDVVVEAEGISKSFGSKIVFRNVNLVINRGEKVAFVGRNGEGKTTMARIIVGELDYEGKLKIGHNVKIGYYAQNQEQLLDENKTVLQTLEEVAPTDYTEGKLRSVLGAFLFSDDEVLKKVKVLSGGERARLALAKLVLQPYNFLLLDEPTNHLDIYAKDVLKQALKQFSGTLLIISHDRDFLTDLAETVYEFNNQAVKQYKGDINYFLEKKKSESFYHFERSQLTDNKVVKNKISSEKKQEYLKRKKQQRHKNRLEQKINQLEDEIENLEQEIYSLEKIFSNINQQIDEKLFSKYDELKKLLTEKLQLWEQLNQELENLDF